MAGNAARAALGFIVAGERKQHGGENGRSRNAARHDDGMRKAADVKTVDRSTVTRPVPLPRAPPSGLPRVCTQKYYLRRRRVRRPALILLKSVTD